MELKNIEAFLMVVEKGSFSAAADALYISQPTISVRIQQMEQYLNTTLFERINGKKIALTQSGEKVYPYFQEAFDLIHKGTEALKHNPLKREKLKISCPNHMGVEIMPEVLKMLYDSFPDFEFQVKVASTDQIIEDIQTGEADLGFTYHPPEDDGQEFSTVKLANEQNILVCAPDHPLAKRDKVVSSDLEDERIIVYNREFVTTKIIEQFLEKNRLKYKQTEISNVGWLKMMVRKGLGIAFLQEIIVKEELVNGKLVKLDLRKNIPSTSIYLITRTTVNQKVKDAIIETSKNLFCIK